MENLIESLHSSPEIYPLPPNIAQDIPNEKPFWVLPPQEKEEIIIGYTQLFSFPIVEDPDQNKHFLHVLMAKEGGESYSVIDPLFFEVFSFVKID